MNITLKSEYSLLALIYIAKRSQQGFVKIQEIASQYDIPIKYLEQLLSNLAKTGIIQTKRGANGGYALAKSAAQITLAEVVRVMDGKLAPTKSSSVYYYAPTPILHEPKLLEEFKTIRNFIAQHLEGISIAQVL